MLGKYIWVQKARYEFARPRLTSIQKVSLSENFIELKGLHAHLHTGLFQAYPNKVSLLKGLYFQWTALTHIAGRTESVKMHRTWFSEFDESIPMAYIAKPCASLFPCELPFSSNPSAPLATSPKHKSLVVVLPSAHRTSIGTSLVYVTGIPSWISMERVNSKREIGKESHLVYYQPQQMPRHGSTRGSWLQLQIRIANWYLWIAYLRSRSPAKPTCFLLRSVERHSDSHRFRHASRDSVDHPCTGSVDCDPMVKVHLTEGHGLFDEPIPRWIYIRVSRYRLVRRQRPSFCRSSCGDCGCSRISNTNRRALSRLPDDSVFQITRKVRSWGSSGTFGSLGVGRPALRPMLISTCVMSRQRRAALITLKFRDGSIMRAAGAAIGTICSCSRS